MAAVIKETQRQLGDGNEAPPTQIPGKAFPSGILPRGWSFIFIHQLSKNPEETPADSFFWLCMEVQTAAGCRDGQIPGKACPSGNLPRGWSLFSIHQLSKNSEKKKSIKEAVTFINTIDVNKLSRLISRIIQKLHLKGERVFSEEEENKLQTALSLDKQALNLVLETSAFILEQAVYHNVKPASLQQQLEAVHLSPDKAEVFSQTWATAGPEMVERLRQNIFAPKKLEHVGWQLNLQMAQSSRAKLKSPSAVLQLGLSTEDSEARENVFVEFNHQELLDFYNKLEIVQGQLDSLT